MKFYRCKCYYYRNVFSRLLNTHVTYTGRTEFIDEYKEDLYFLGYKTPEKINLVVSEIEQQINERLKLDEAKQRRTRLVESSYKRLHPFIYTFSESYLDENFLYLVSMAKNWCADRPISKEEIPRYMDVLCEEKRLYQFPVFSKDFCEKLVAELNNFEGTDLEKGRPNTMNRFGTNLDELGFNKNFLDVFRESYLNPLARILYPEWIGDHLDSHKAFTVKYKKGGDRDLACHFDNSEVTLNVCLSSTKSSGGDLLFGSMVDELGLLPNKFCFVKHIVGSGVFHRGRQLHSASSIEDGERQNLVIWMRSSSIRNSKCPMCGEKPDLEEAYGYGDGFTGEES